MLFPGRSVTQHDLHALVALKEEAVSALELELVEDVCLSLQDLLRETASHLPHEVTRLLDL